jgi:zinc-binding alcohol dehydrogenase/oxidoreductase
MIWVEDKNGGFLKNLNRPEIKNFSGAVLELMQALVLQSTLGKDANKYDPLVLSKVPIPTPKEGEILIKIHSCSLNHRDLFIRQGLYPKIVSGSTLGSDCSGSVVTSTKNFPSGSPVILNPSVNWKDKRACPEDPSSYGMLGLLPLPGTLAEYICVPEELVYAKPSHLSFEQAAALPLAGLTAFRACFTKGYVFTAS